MSVLLGLVWLGAIPALFLAGVWAWRGLRREESIEIDNFDGVGLDARHNPDLEFKP